MRCVIARVLPVPAPASTQTGPRVASATSRCSGSSPASGASAVLVIASATCLILPYPGAVRGCDPGRVRPSRGDRAAPRERNQARRCYTGQVISTTSRRRAQVSGQLTMYTTTWCGFCRNLKKQLARDGIEMVEVDIERDEAAAEFVMSVNGGNQTVPTVVFPDGTALTNPSAAQVKAQLAASAGKTVGLG